MLSIILLFSRISLALAFVGFHLPVLVKSQSSLFSGFQHTAPLLTKKPLAPFLKSLRVTLPNLPYDYAALEPHISEKTLRVHHGKHHAKYVSTAKEMMAETPMENMDLVSVIRESYSTVNQGLFNNVGQCFNHAFYWESMKPNGGGKPSGSLLAVINENFGNFDAFRAEFVKSGMTAFGSGWAWLTYSVSTGGLVVTNTIGANNPLTELGMIPLMVVDVWEHAYYLDYQNMRATYLDKFLDHLVNWDMVQARLDSVRGVDKEL